VISAAPATSRNWKAQRKIILIVELMSDLETPPPLPPQLSNIQNSLYSVIENSKKQQWIITNYVILLCAAIFALSRWLNSLALPLTPNERRVFIDLILLAWVYSSWLLVQIQFDLRRYRKQLEAFHTQTISQRDWERFQLKRLEYPFWRGGWFLFALLGVVLIGAALVIYSSRSRKASIATSSSASVARPMGPVNPMAIRAPLPS
jgi:hypothetical protein